jgi:hypothetical protein
MEDVRYNSDGAVKRLKELGARTSKATLAKQRCIGGGPQFYYIGRFPNYTETGLQQYVAGMTTGPVRSTTEGGRQQPSKRGRAPRRRAIEAIA